MRGEDHGPAGGERHLLQSQSSSPEAMQERHREVGAILGPTRFWKDASKCRNVPSLSICEGAGRLLLNLDSWPCLRDAEFTGSQERKPNERQKGNNVIEF